MMDTRAALRHYRKEKDMSQEEVALALGVSRQTVYRWESGTSVPSVENLSSLCRLYGVTMETLYGGQKTPVEAVPAPTSEPKPVPGGPVSPALQVRGGVCYDKYGQSASVNLKEDDSIKAYPHVSRGLWIISIAEILTLVSSLLGVVNIPAPVLMVLELVLGIIRLVGCGTAMREVPAYWKSLFTGIAYVVLTVPVGLHLTSYPLEAFLLKPLCTAMMLLFVLETCFTTADLLQDRDRPTASFGKKIIWLFPLAIVARCNFFIAESVITRYIVINGDASITTKFYSWPSLLAAGSLSAVVFVIFYYRLITFLRTASGMLAYSSPQEEQPVSP